MNNIFFTILILSVSGGALTILLYALRPITARLFSASWNYYMLLASLLFFIIPFNMQVPLLENIIPAVELDLSINGTSRPADITLKSTGGQIAVSQDYYSASNHAKDNDCIVTEAFSIEAFIGKSIAYIPYIWLLGVLVSLTLKVRQYKVFVHKMVKQSAEIKCMDKLNKFEACKNELHIKRYFRLIENPVIYTPMLAGVIKPAVILPAMSIKGEELYLIFKHELTHYRRRDIYFKIFIQLISSIHWFNPLVHAASRSADRLCELSCDEVLAAGMDYTERKQYGEMLLNLLDKAVKRKAGICPALCETKSGIKRRLLTIMNFKKINRGILILSILTITILCGIGFITSYAMFRQNMHEGKAIENYMAAEAIKTENVVLATKADLKVPEADLPMSEMDGTLEERLIQYLEYKNKVLGGKNDLGMELAQFMLDDVRKTGSEPDYYVISELLDVNWDNGLDKTHSVCDLFNRVSKPGIFWNSNYDSYSSDRMTLLKKVAECNPEAFDIINNVYIKKPVTLLYVNTKGKISKMIWDDFMAKVNQGVDPLE